MLGWIDFFSDSLPFPGGGLWVVCDEIAMRLACAAPGNTGIRCVWWHGVSGKGALSVRVRVAASPLPRWAGSFSMCF